MPTANKIPVPYTLTNTEDLCLWLNTEGRGKSVDLQGRTLRPKGGYEKDVYGLDWHEHPHAHWYLPILPRHTKIINGEIIVSERIALICEGTGIAIENMRFDGVPNLLRYSNLSPQQLRGQSNRAPFSTVCALPPPLHRAHMPHVTCPELLDWTYRC